MLASGLYVLATHFVTVSFGTEFALIPDWLRGHSSLCDSLFNEPQDRDKSLVAQFPANGSLSTGNTRHQLPVHPTTESRL
jgi:hypothetical protein